MEGGPGGAPGGGGAEGGAGGAPKGAPGGLQEKVEQDQSDRDQTGRKDATQYPFGEDPRGAVEIQSKPGTERETKYKFRGSPLGVNEGVGIKPQVDTGVINNLKAFLSKTLSQDEKELLSEVQSSGNNMKSLLDEGNIMDE